MAIWTDSHNHLQDPRLGDPEMVIALMKKEGVIRCVVNATSEEDWPAVEKLAVTHPGFVLPAFGIHPWKAHTVTDGWQSRLLDLLDRHPLASIGECGLDRWVSFPSIDVQLPVFRAQMEMSRETGRPLTIHCLKAWGLLMDAIGMEPLRFLLHSFGGSQETALQLLSMGARFSFSGHFLHPRKADVLQVFRKLPHDRIFLETDAPDMLPPSAYIRHPLPENHHHPANLPEIGRGLAAALGMSSDELARITHENASVFFCAGA
jgi:TatD DNase family protein